LDDRETGIQFQAGLENFLRSYHVGPRAHLASIPMGDSTNLPWDKATGS